ncbi:hypothetical protein DRO59_00590 [Candidatus Bathyarchaeota archaeon]|nr:MAG: hypothetical protein DRO59_00590 [Candidatus Bathyarchaeota archaeon]
MEKRRFIPPFIYCPKCSRKIFLEELRGEERHHIKNNGYVAGGRGICDCGVVAVLCVQKMPKSPTFSLFFDVYELPKQKGNIVVSQRNI